MYICIKVSPTSTISTLLAGYSYADNRKYALAMACYIDAFCIDPSQPLTALVLASHSILLSQHTLVKKRHETLMKAFGCLEQYKHVRLSQTKYAIGNGGEPISLTQNNYQNNNQNNMISNNTNNSQNNPSANITTTTNDNMNIYSDDNDIPIPLPLPLPLSAPSFLPAHSIHHSLPFPNNPNTVHNANNFNNLNGQNNEGLKDINNVTDEALLQEV